jgi:hypothetical protein
MRVAIFSAVVLPAPFAPMRPNASPSSIAKLTSRSASTTGRGVDVRLASAARSSRSAR